MIYNEPDKQKHYDFCKNLTKKAPFILRPVWGLGVFVGVSVGKELIWDKMLGKGTPDCGDIKANLKGVIDGILNR